MVRGTDWNGTYRKFFRCKYILYLVFSLFKCIYNSGTPKVLHSIAGNYTSIKYFKNHIKFDFSGILPPKSITSIIMRKISDKSKLRNTVQHTQQYSSKL